MPSETIGLMVYTPESSMVVSPWRAVLLAPDTLGFFFGGWNNEK